MRRPSRSKELELKVYGYVKKVGPKDFVEISEVTFTGSASASSIREITQFLLAAADQMEKKGGQFDHAYIGEVTEAWLEKGPDIIVARGS
jgi:hypothetical protein